LDEIPVSPTTLLILQRPRYLQVYLLLCLLGRPASASELAVYLGLSEPTVRRTLKMLARFQIVDSLGCWRFQAAPSPQPASELGQAAASWLVQLTVKPDERRTS
jgi:DNA-binding IclR family transcriptional regulator